MGLFDSCIQRVPAETDVGPLLAPTEETCTNCHSTPPSETICPAQTNWPETLFRPIEAIARDPEGLRWWIQENRLRTELRGRARRETFPVELGRHSLRIEVDPNERTIDSTFITSDTRFFMNLTGEGMRVFLNSSPLLEGRDLGWIGGLRLFFENHSLTSNSILMNWFFPPQSNLVSMIPVAFDEASGRTYGYSEYTRLALISHNCGAPTDPSAYEGFDGGIPPPRDGGVGSLDGSPVLDLPPEILEEMRVSAPNLGTGYADAGCGYFEAMPQRFPYLFELVHHLAHSDGESTQVDLLRLYPDLLALRRLGARHPNPSSDTNFLSFLDRVRVVWNVAPSRVAFENFLLEFHPDTAEHPLSVTMQMRGAGLPSLETDSRVHLSSLYVPGWIHLGETTARLQGQGPELSVHLTELDGEILPFDLGQSDPAERGWLHVRGGRVEEGAETLLAGTALRPGIHVESVDESTMEYSANLNVSWTVELSDGRPLQLSGNLAARGRLRRTAAGVEAVPGSTTLLFQNLRLAPVAAPETSPPPPWIEGASLLLSDRDEDRPGEESGFILRAEIPETSLAHYRAAHAEIFFPLSSAEGRYQPDLSFQDFQTELLFDLDGRSGARDTHGSLSFSTHQPEACTRTYESLLNVDRIGVPMGSGLSVFLSALRGRVQVSQELDEDGVSHFEVPVLDFSARSGGGGIFRGPLRLRQEGGPRRALTVSYNPQDGRVGIQNLNLRFLLERIVIPALSNGSRDEAGAPPQVTGVDVDGRFRGHWSLDATTGRGRGSLCLVGDERDVVLRGGDGRPLEHPLISDTRWCASSVSRADTARQILWGNFFLDTTIDWGLLRYFGIHVNMRVRGRMAHDNLPYWTEGYPNLERIFFRRVFQEHRRDLLREELR